MDPFVALGAVASICQFVGYGIQILREVKELNTSGSLHVELEADTEQLSSVISELKLSQPSSGKSQSEIAVLNLSRECLELSTALMKYIDKLKLKGSRSFPRRLAIAIRSKFTDSKREELEKRLQSCRSRLHLCLTIVSKSETAEKLNQVIKTGKVVAMDMDSLRRNVESLQSSVTSVKAVNIEPADMAIIQSLIKLSNEAMRRALQSDVLNAIYLPDLTKRFDEISEAHEGTFLWLLDESGYDANDAANVSLKSLGHETGDFDSTSSTRKRGGLAEKSKVRLAASRERIRNQFVYWLRSSQPGQELFFIRGKPGAGKSTMMKLLCRQATIIKHLKIWSQDETIVVGTFSFWKPGSKLQNTTSGMIRGLLFSILDKNPHLIPVAFPALWEDRLCQPLATGSMDQQEIQQAFRNLISSAHEQSNFKVVILIDGLDECNSNLRDLINDILSWLVGSRKAVKVCVSGRDLNDFGKLDLYPTFWVQDVTSNDLSSVITARFRALRSVSVLDWDNWQDLLRILLDKAEGIFLWVSLVLNVIEDGALSGDTFEELNRKILDCPGELEQLFKHLVDTIQRQNRAWAFRAISLAICPLVYEDQAQAGLRWSNMLGTRTRGMWKFSLLQSCFLTEFIENSQFAFQMETEDADDDTINQKLDAAVKKVSGYCKGLLEVSYSQGEKRDEFLELLNFKGQNSDGLEKLRWYITPIHRSVVEFMTSDELQKLMSPHLENFCPFQAHCQTLLAARKCAFPSGRPYGFEDTRNRRSRPACFPRDHQQFRSCLEEDLQPTLLFGVLTENSGSPLLFQFLDALVQIAVHRCKGHLVFGTSSSENFDSLQCKMWAWTALMGVHRYSPWLFETGRESIMQNFSKEVVNCTATHFIYHYARYRDYFDNSMYNGVLEQLCKAGFDPNIENYAGTSLWSFVIQNMIAYPRMLLSTRVLDYMYKLGVEWDIEVGVIIREEDFPSETHLPSGGPWFVFEPSCELDPDGPWPWQLFFVRQSAPIVQIMRGRNYVTLQDMFNLWFPEGRGHVDALFEVLRKGDVGDPLSLFSESSPEPRSWLGEDYYHLCADWLHTNCPSTLFKRDPMRPPPAFLERPLDDSVVDRMYVIAEQIRKFQWLDFHLDPAERDRNERRKPTPI